MSRATVLVIVPLFRSRHMNEHWLTDVFHSVTALKANFWHAATHLHEQELKL